MSKLVVVLGPTATGKTRLAVNIANKFNGEIISADSRQIYKGMDIGTGKDLAEYHNNNINTPYHLINILEPNVNYSVFQFKKDFWNIYNALGQKNKLPILCGGTGLYIESVLLNYQMPTVPPNISLRSKMDNKSIDYLKKYLQSIDGVVYDKNYHITKRRMIRAIEISLSGDIDEDKNIQSIIARPLVFGLKADREELLINIKNRLEKRIQSGMIDEVQSLINKGITLDRLKYFGLEYKFIGQYLYNEIKFDDMIEKLNFAINRFSKRQMTFFRRMENRGIDIRWVLKNQHEKINQHIKKYIR